MEPDSVLRLIRPGLCKKASGKIGKALQKLPEDL
jgi:hypothetical protein